MCLFYADFKRDMQRVSKIISAPARTRQACRPRVCQSCARMRREVPSI